MQARGLDELSWSCTASLAHPSPVLHPVFPPTLRGHRGRALRCARPVDAPAAGSALRCFRPVHHHPDRLGKQTTFCFKEASKCRSTPCPTLIPYAFPCPTLKRRINLPDIGITLQHHGPASTLLSSLVGRSCILVPSGGEESQPSGGLKGPTTSGAFVQTGVLFLSESSPR